MVEVSLFIEADASLRLAFFARDWLAHDAEPHGISASIYELQTAIN